MQIICHRLGLSRWDVLERGAKAFSNETNGTAVDTPSQLQARSRTIFRPVPTDKRWPSRELTSGGRLRQIRGLLSFFRAVGGSCKLYGMAIATKASTM
jgi:hypothetical protein